MRLQHARVSLELHELAHRSGPSLLLLHALYGSSADWRELPNDWPGAVYALDFCGHGRSDRLAAGGYTPELLAADADCALAHIGRAVVAGAGIGAYVAVLLAGARRDLIPAALLLPGFGLAGGGALPSFTTPRPGFAELDRTAHHGAAYDPLVAVLDEDIRPIDYVEPFAHTAHKLLLVGHSADAPPWWQVVRGGPNTEVFSDARFALARLADIAPALA